MSRWVHPFAPDSDFHGGDTYLCERRNLYRAKAVYIARSANIGRNVVVGPSSRLEENSQIKSSVIGANCKIGKNCVVENAILWDNVTICDGCVIKDSVLADGVLVHENSEVLNGSILGRQVFSIAYGRCK